MLSPSLTTAIIHVVSRSLPIPAEPWSQISLFSYLHTHMRKLNTSWPSLPIIARTDQFKGHEFFGEIERFDLDGRPEQSDRGGGTFFWGRVRVDRLVDYARRYGDTPASKEVVDFGTAFNFTTIADGGHDAETVCRRLLAKTREVENASCIIGMVDVGVSAQDHEPDTFGGKLTHLVTGGVVLSAHAKRVLAVLLERLDQHGILDRVHVVCALVVSSDPILSGPFDRGNAPQVHSALDRLFHFVRMYDVPASLNLSMGTHVGPHNGQSPLEEFVSKISDARRTLHVSAGNDGLRGIHAVRRVLASSGEDLILQTGPAGDEFVLVEFWWSDQCGPLSIEVEVRGPEGQPVLSRPVTIESIHQSAVLAPYRPGDPRLTLVANRCYHDMNCISFGMTPSEFSNLASLQIHFSFSSNEHPHVHAWIVRSGDSRTSFVGSTHDATLCVPATARNAIGVAGALDERRAWPASSRGAERFHPAAAPTHECHDIYWGDYHAPLLAHRVQFGINGESGTSYASPRACADTAELQMRLNVPATDVREIARHLLGASYAEWNSRTGFGILPESVPVRSVAEVDLSPQTISSSAGTAPGLKSPLRELAGTVLGSAGAKVAKSIERGRGQRIKDSTKK